MNTEKHKAEQVEDRSLEQAAAAQASVIRQQAAAAQASMIRQ
ncbi:hypothetical protein ACE6ED_02410 [Paenibacillus sp. CN-4]